MENEELTMCPACDAGIPRKTVILIGNSNPKLSKDFLEKIQKAMEDAGKSDTFFIIDNPLPKENLIRKYEETVLNSQEYFLRKKEKYKSKKMRRK